MASSSNAAPAGVGSLAVVFTSIRNPVSEDGGPPGYAQTAEEMVRMAAEQPGYLGMESVRGPDGFGITVSYWRDEASIRAWKAVADHQAAQRAGRERWYRAYRTRVCRIEREYGFER